MLNERDARVVAHIATKDSLRWWDLVECVCSYERSSMLMPGLLKPKSFMGLERLLNFSKPGWRDPMAKRRGHMHDCLPVYAIEYLHQLIHDRQRRNSLRTRFGVGGSAVIMKVLSSALNNISRAKHVMVQQREDAVFDGNGFRQDAWALLDKMEMEFKKMYPSYSKEKLHWQYVMEVVDACRSVVTYLGELIHSSELVSVPTRDGIDNVPFHAENYASADDREKVLCGLVNSVVGAFVFYNNRLELKEFYSHLYGGNCIEGRSRELLEDFSHKASNSTVLSASDEINALAKQCLMQQLAVGKLPQRDDLVKHVLRMSVGRRYQVDAHFCQRGVLERQGVECYIDNALIYTGSFSYLDSEPCDRKITDTVSVFQANVRRRQKRSDFLTLQKEITKLQAYFRRDQCCELLRNMRQQKIADSVSVFQANVRRKLQQSGFVKLRQGVSMFQAHVRGRQCRATVDNLPQDDSSSASAAVETIQDIITRSLGRLYFDIGRHCAEALFCCGVAVVVANRFYIDLDVPVSVMTMPVMR